MNLTTLNQTQNRNRQRGGISVGGLLMVCVVILLAALGTVGYLLYRSHSGQMEAEAKRLAAEKQLEEEKARTTKAEADKTKQERENRLAIAQSLRDSFAGRAGVVTNNLHGLLERIPQVERELTDFRKGSAGVPVTQFPDLVEACSTFLSAKLNVPKRSIGVTHLEGVRRILIRNAENRGTETQPSPEAEKVIDEARSWADSADADLTKVSAFIKSMLEEAQAKVPEANAKSAASLDDAIQAMRIRNARAIAKDETEAKKTAQQLEEDAKNKGIVDDGKRKAQQLIEEGERKKREAAAALAKQKLVEEAQSSSIQNLLAPVITPGRIDCDGKLLEEKGPMSWGKLSGFISGDNGVRVLHQITFSNLDKDRPRLPRSDLKRDAATYDRVVEMRRALQRLGPTLVELKMLNP
jgi:nucleotide-binding universal stress UspA family protein